MNTFFKKIGHIILIHFVWEIFVLLADSNTDSFNEYIRAISFLLIEPFALFILYPIIVYFIIIKIIKKEPISIKNEKKVLLIFSIILTILSMGWIACSMIDKYIESGFEIFLYKDYWEDIFLKR